MAVFAQDGIAHGLRLADGRARWAWPGRPPSSGTGPAISGMWSWHGIAAVLTGEAGPAARITGLAAATGAVRWIRRLPGSGVLGTPVVTSGGGLAMIGTDGVLRVVSLATGRVRWARFAGRSRPWLPPMA